MKGYGDGKRSRILFLTNNTVGTGEYIRAFSLARRLAKRSYEPTVVASAPGAGLHKLRTTKHGVTVLTFADPTPRWLRSKGFSPVDIGLRIRALRGVDFDLIHTYGHRPSVSIPARALRRQRKSLIIADWADLWGYGGIADERGWLGRNTIGRLDDMLERRYRSESDALIVATDHLRGLAISWGMAESRVLQMPAGANPDLITPLDKEKARREFGVPAGAPVIVYSGFSHFDLPYLSDVIGQLAILDPSVVLLMIGRRRLPRELAELQRSGTAKILSFGPVDYAAMGKLLACGDLMFVPLPKRGLNLGRFPNRIGDYMAAGRPIVTNRGTDVGRVVRGERIGIAADDSPKEMALAILELLEKPDLLESMGRRSRQMAETRYSWDRLADKLHRFYTEVLGLGVSRGRSHVG